MIAALRRIRESRGPIQPVVTACWTAEEVSILVWTQPLGTALVCTDWAKLGATACDAETFMATVKGLVPGCPKRTIPMEWILIEPSAGAYSNRKQGHGVTEVGQLPEWIKECWDELPMSWLPRVVYSGMACVEHELLKWASFSNEGTGFYFSSHGRGFFLGYAKGVVFTRISRPMEYQEPHTVSLDDEWLTQTRMLYRNRTGLELHKVILPEEEDCVLSNTDESAAELVCGLRPPAWTSSQTGGVPPSVLFLHATALRSRGEPACVQALNYIEPRRRRNRTEFTLKMGVILLLGGWIFLLQGACSSRHATQAFDMSGWSVAAQKWQEYDKTYRAQSAHRTARETPYRLIGAVAQSVPKDTQLKRIQIKRVEKDKREELLLVLEGEYTGSEPSGVFREWMKTLKESGQLSQVRNLSFQPNTMGLGFTMKGSSEFKEEDL